MIDELSLRTWLALALAIATGAVVFLLSRDAQAAVAALAGCVALVVDRKSVV